MHKRIPTIKYSDILIPIAFLVVILLLWQIATPLFHIPSYILPPPIPILKSLITQATVLTHHTFTTLTEAILGFLIANILAFILSVIFAHSPTVRKGLYPYAIALKTTPLIAMAPILVLWLGTDIASKVASSALICFFPLLVNSVKGLRSTDEEFLKLFKSLNASPVQTFLKLRLPNALPYIFSGLKISSSLSIIGAVVGEFVGANKGLGYIILVSSYHMDTPMMFAATLTLTLCGVIFFGIIAILEHIIVFWEQPKDA